LYQAGQLKDEDPAETRDYTDWATCIETMRHRESLYDALVREALRKTPLQQPISLAELRQTLKPAVARAA